MRLAALMVLPLLLTACLSEAQAPGGAVTGPSMQQSDPQIVSTLLQLMDVKDNTHPLQADFDNTALKDLIHLGTPRGFQLRNRYTELGVPLTEALEPTDDPRLKEQMLELARWDRNPEIRAVGLLELAERKDPASEKYFNEALLNSDPGVRFAAIEALELWSANPANMDAAKTDFARVLNSDTQPILKAYAAQALLRRGGQQGRDVLVSLLDSGDWVARAMAARYLGDLGTGPDYDLLLDRMSREQTNNFVIAEYAIACLKLFPKKTPAAAAAPPPPSAAPAPANDGELEPLVVTAPRLKIPATALIDGRINAQLLRLLQDQANSGQTAEQLQDPSIKTLNSLVSPAGFRLLVRYNQLGFLLTEGLAGTSDLMLRQQILNVARQGTNPQIRAAALLAIAYNHDPGDRSVFQEALMSQDFTVRFGAVEALETWGKDGATQDISGISRMDLSAFLQVYAAGTLMRMGDSGEARDILIRHWLDDDWVVRALATRLLGEMGQPEDYTRMLMQLDREQNNFVKTELAGALLRLKNATAKAR